MGCRVSSPQGEKMGENGGKRGGRREAGGGEMS